MVDNQLVITENLVIILPFWLTVWAWIFYMLKPLLWGWKLLIVQGPVFQSIVSLTSLFRVIPLTVLADSIHNILIFFAEKMWAAFALQKLLTFFFSKKFQHICVSLKVNFNESLTNDVVSFEQLGPGFYVLYDLCQYNYKSNAEDWKNMSH